MHTKKILSVLVVALCATIAFAVPNNNSAAATVNLIRNEVITNAELNAQMQSLGASEDQALAVLNIMINDEVFLQGAERDGVTVTDAQKDALYSQQKASYIQQSGGTVTDEQFDQMAIQSYGSVDAYKEALDGIKEFASSLFGDVASDIADAILSGTGNLEAEMDDILFNIKQKVTKAMLENMILTDIFNEDLQNAIIDALKNGDVYLANNLFSQGMDELRNLLPEYKEFAESIGAVDASGSSSSTENTALSSVSQESFDMYSGRVANIQTHVIAIDRGVTSIVANSAMTVNLLTDISNDTARLLSIQKAVESTQSYISEIVLKGIKIR